MLGNLRQVALLSAHFSSYYSHPTQHSFLDTDGHAVKKIYKGIGENFRAHSQMEKAGSDAMLHYCLM